MVRSGRACITCAWRRTEEVPRTAPKGMQSNGLAGLRRPAVRAEDQRVAGILAGQRAGEDDAGGQLGFQVLQAVHGEVDAAVQQRLVDLLGEQALAAEVGQAAVLHRIAGGADDGGFGGSVGSQGVDHQAGLDQGERRASGADAQGWHGSGHGGVVLLRRVGGKSECGRCWASRRRATRPRLRCSMRMGACWRRRWRARSGSTRRMAGWCRRSPRGLIWRSCRSRCGG